MTMMETPRPLPRATHQGVVRFGSATCAVVLLETGERGYVWEQLVTALGFAGPRAQAQFVRSLDEIAPQAMARIAQTYTAAMLPGGDQVHVVTGYALTTLFSCVATASLTPGQRNKHHATVQRCQSMLQALAMLGETALIDEATGFQPARAPDALRVQLLASAFPAEGA